VDLVLWPWFLVSRYGVWRVRTDEGERRRGWGFVVSPTGFTVHWYIHPLNMFVLQLSPPAILIFRLLVICHQGHLSLTGSRGGGSNETISLSYPLKYCSQSEAWFFPKKQDVTAQSTVVQVASTGEARIESVWVRHLQMLVWGTSATW
jgi:hypothetical protein